MTEAKADLAKRRVVEDLNERSREIFRNIVEAYVETGEPIGSRTLAKCLNMNLSPASIRNTMADLEELGLLFAPHPSAGRLPTELGLRFFVDGILEVGNLSTEERSNIETLCAGSGRAIEEVFSEATTMLSGLSHCAGLVIAPKRDRPIKHIEFVSLDAQRTLVVLVAEDGTVENRVIESPTGTTPADLAEASNYLNARLRGATLEETRDRLRQELERARNELKEVTSRVVEAGLASWGGEDHSTLIVRGQSKLLEDVKAVEDLEDVRMLFDTLETKEGLERLIQLTTDAEGVRIYIGSENALFGLSGCSLIVAPYHDSREHVVGAIGVIGPTRINYRRIIPMVDYTAKVIDGLVG